MLLLNPSKTKSRVIADIFCFSLSKNLNVMTAVHLP